MMRLGVRAILTILSLVALTQCTCNGLERGVSDYIVPIFKAKGLNLAEIRRDVQWLEEDFQAYHDGRKTLDIAFYLRILKDKLKPGLVPSFSTQEFPGLMNDDFKSISSYTKLDARSHVLIHIIESIQSIMNNASCEFDHWLTIAKISYILYGLPTSNSMIIHDLGIKFSPRNPPPNNRALKLLLNYLTGIFYARCMERMEVNYGGVEELDIDRIFAENAGKSSLSDEEIWRLAFHGDMKEQDAVEFLRSDISHEMSEKLVSWFEDIKAKPRYLRMLENTAGMVILGMSISPGELRKFKAIGYSITKRMEYFRLYNQNSYCLVNCSFLVT